MPRFEDRLECLVFAMRFASMSEPLHRSLDTLAAAYYQVIYSTSLKTLLGIIHEKLRTVTVSSLVQLGWTITTKNKRTVMHSVVRDIKDHYPHVLEFQRELGSVAPAERESWAWIQEWLGYLEQGREMLQRERDQRRQVLYIEILQSTQSLAPNMCFVRRL